MSNLRKGFTLVEMMVIAPVVILLIGSFVALIVNLTGEVLSSRGQNTITYDIQDALNRIEEDVKLSTTYLAVNNIPLTTTKQGFGTDTTNGSTVNFTNVQKAGGSNASLILNSLVTNGNPMSTSAGVVYLANKPNDCTTLADYSQNTPMTMNVVYFVDNNSTLWRRVIMQPDYANASIRCGAAPWQQPSCLIGYSPGTMTFCKTNDVRLLDGVDPADFIFNYYASSDSDNADATAVNSTATDSARNTSLQSTPTVEVNITARKTIAGRDISGTGKLRATRLDVNASSIAVIPAPTTAPAAPTVSSKVTDGHIVTFTWPRVDGAESYDLEYRVNSGAWQSNAGTTNLDNNSRSYVVSSATHTDVVEARVRSTNSFGDSAFSSNVITIPLWAPIKLNDDWTHYGGTYSTPAYTKTKSGIVMLKGLIKATSAHAFNDVIGSFPADYKPSGRLIFGATTSPNASARIDVSPGANSTDIIFGSGDQAYISLNSISYVPSTPVGVKTVPTLQNGFTALGGSFEGPTYTQDPTTKRVTIQGTLDNGTRTNGTIIFSLPAAMLPAQYHHYPSRSSTFHHLGISQTDGLVAKGDGTSAYSINSSFLPASVTGWTNLTLLNGWVNYGGGFSTAQYVKTSDGVVQLKGLVRYGTSDIAVLPAGFRPKQRIVSVAVDNAAYGRIDILPDGTISFQGPSNNWYDLSSIFFPAEQ